MKKFMILALMSGLMFSACDKKEDAPAAAGNAPAAEASADAKADAKEDTKADDAAPAGDSQYMKDGKLDKDALKALYAGKKTAESSAIDIQLLKDSAPEVRAYAWNRATRNYDNESDELKALIDNLKAEKNPEVLAAGLKSLMNNLKVSTDLYSFYKECATHSDAKVRGGAAMGIINSNNASVDGIFDEAMKFLNDADKTVRGNACRDLGRLNKPEAVVPALDKILQSNDENDVAVQDKCFEGLMNMWYNAPMFDKFDESAYKASMNYLKKTPRTDKVPAWQVVSPFKKAPKDSWKNLAKGFDAKALVATLTDIVKDENAGKMLREYAIEAIGAQGEKADLEALNAALTDDKLKAKVTKALEKK